MKRFSKLSWLLIALLLPVLAACGGGGTAATPTTDTGPVFTQIAETALAMQTQTAAAVSLTPTFTNTPAVTPTLQTSNTPLITNTPLPGEAATATPLVLATAVRTQSAACDNFANVVDVTVPDNTEITAGTSFVKTWAFTNAGPCDWNQDYTLVFSYDNVDGATGWDKVKPVHFPDTIVPGDTMDISVTLTAPGDPGTYRGVFRLQNDKGYNFGIEFWVQIVVP
jgi:hypothetical protein